MPSKKCHICLEIVEAVDWDAHLRRHRDDRSPRKGGGRPWRRIRAAIIARDGGQCTEIVDGVRCAARSNLEVHHINENHEDNRAVNLRTVCFDHNPRGRRVA